MSSLENFNKENQLHEFVNKSISDLHALMILDKKGNLLSYFVSDSCASVHCLPDLQIIAKGISIRFPIGEFHKDLGPPEITINIFRDFYMLVRYIFEDDILAVVVPKNTNLMERIKAVQEIDKGAQVVLINGLKKIPSEQTEFQKSYQKNLTPRKYVLVAQNLRKASEYSDPFHIIR